MHDKIKIRLAQFIRTYDIEITPFDDREGRHAGHIVLLYDVTEQARLIEDLQEALANVRNLQQELKSRRG